MHTFAYKNYLLRKVLKKIADFRTPLSHDRPNWEQKNYWLRLAGLNISKCGVAIGSGFRCIDGHEEKIFIDDYAAIGYNVHLWNFDNIRIGRFCMIAADVVITNGWHNKNTFEPGSGPVAVGNGCWIGTAARIVGGITIGDNSIVGAGAVVIDDVPPSSIAVGVPAKIIGVRDLPDRVWHLGNVYFSPREFQLMDRPE